MAFDEPQNSYELIFMSFMVPHRTIGLVSKETWHHVIGRWKRRRDGGFGSLPFGKLKSKIEKGELDGDELKHRIEDRSFPNESDDLIYSLHLRLLSSTGVSVGVSLQIERSQLPIERSQLRNLNPLPFDSGPVCKLLSSPNPRRIVPILARTIKVPLINQLVP
ncbi:hypothetical protein Bca101_060614 [Brassica carinata]